jgi:hypothetical protein
MTTAPPPDASDPSSTSGSATPPPLSSIPPPTITHPLPPPKEPSDLIKPVTLTGSASRHPSGCILFKTTDRGTFDLVGDGAAQTLQHPKVTVVAMPQPNATSACDVAVMAVRSVTPVS